MTAEQKYQSALELYKTTEMSITAISRECSVSRAGFASFINRCHRDLMFARHGYEGVSPENKMRRSRGQSPKTREKYREAIAACDSEEYIHLNVSQIAYKFKVDATGLGNQLRTHYPDIVERREKERKKRGIADNFHRGARPYAVETYRPAVELLKTTDMTIREAADVCNVSFGGLREHVLQYHRSLVESRMGKRLEGGRIPKIGKVSGNGSVRLPKEEQNRQYAEALELYRNTSLTMKDICQKTGVKLSGLKNYLRMWHKDLIFKRRGAILSDDASDRQSLEGVKRANPRTAIKYSSAIAELETGDVSVEAVARKYGFIPEVFRQYIKQHHFDLWRTWE